MFSLLNERFQRGKPRARMCKFLNSLPQFFPGLWRSFSRGSYLIDNARLKRERFAAIGHRIAFLVFQPVLPRLCCGKD